MRLPTVGLIDKSSRHVPYSDLLAVARALQTQLDRDFTPIWGVHAHVIAFDRAETVPAAVWPMTIVDKPVGGLGIHLDKAHHPFAQIMATSDWSATASHEMLEMLVDPLGRRFVQAPDIDPSSDGHGVQYLVEVADPCEIYTYTIDGIVVSDFVTPDFYDPHAARGAELDLLSRLARPYEVPKGGYLSWFDPVDRRWHQKQPDGSFVRSRRSADLRTNPRDDRDRALGEDPATRIARHNLSEIRETFAPASPLRPRR